jgi:sec-independent protein translocase protein TatA
VEEETNGCRVDRQHAAILAQIALALRSDPPTIVDMGPEWIVVLVVILVLFGGSQLPKLARGLGSAQREFKKGLDEGAADDDKKNDDKKD